MAEYRSICPGELECPSFLFTSIIHYSSLPLYIIHTSKLVYWYDRAHQENTRTLSFAHFWQHDDGERRVYDDSEQLESQYDDGEYDELDEGAEAYGNDDANPESKFDNKSESVYDQEEPRDVRSESVHAELEEGEQTEMQSESCKSVNDEEERRVYADDGEHDVVDPGCTFDERRIMNTCHGM